MTATHESLSITIAGRTHDNINPARADLQLADLQDRMHSDRMARARIEMVRGSLALYEDRQAEAALHFDASTANLLDVLMTDQRGMLRPLGHFIGSLLGFRRHWMAEVDRRIGAILEDSSGYPATPVREKP